MKGPTRIFLTALLIFSALALALPEQVLPHGVSGAVTFQSPSPLSINAGTDALPTSVRLANGQLWVAWETIPSIGQASIVYTTYNGLWSSIVTFASGPSNVANISPSIAQLQNGTIIMAWAMNQTGHYNLYYKLNNNGVWSSQIRLTSTSSDDYLPKLAVSTNSTLWVFWERDSTSSSCISGLCRQIYYKTLKGNQWSSDTGYTTNSVWSSMPGPMATGDGRIWLSWSSSASASSGFNILYSIYNGQWSASFTLTTTSTSDTHPDLVADRNGTLWLFFTRDIVLSNGSNGVSENDLYSMYSSNLGSTWTSPIQMTVGGSPSKPVDSQEPTAVQAPDKMLWVFYSTDTGGAMSFDIYYIRSNPIATHDVIISGAQYPSFWYQGGMPSIGENELVRINLTITNIGDFTDSISTTATISNTTSYNLGTRTGSLAAGQSITFLFSWNATVVKLGKYTLSATLTDTAEPVLNTYNNLQVQNAVRIVPWGDVEQDGNVNLQDVSVFVYDFGFTPATPSRWCAVCDVTGNGVIDLLDVSIAVKNFGIVS